MSENIFDSYQDVNKFTYYSELRKIRSRLLTIAALLFASDLFGMLLSNMLTVQMLLWSLLVPVIIASLAFLAFKEPLAAMIIATIIIGGLWIYITSLTGLAGAFSGFLVKGIVIYLLITGITSAKNAQRLKKELGDLV